MGCGVVCGLQPKIVNYTRYSKRNIEQLFPYLKISKPFLSQKRYHHFIETFKNNHQNYILKVNDVVGLEENVQEAIMQKWKFLLYGLDKGDEIYKRCLSFQVRSQKQNVTNDYKAIKNNSSLINTSYHEIKRDPQYHECFQQIEKDLNRTFEFKMQKKQIFENVLKRISNYFPSMGYTQGVNFIVGYLLVLGYSQSDTFWMFIHLAINKRYLILGMYEDGFPLTYIYTLIFKNILKRKDPQLYNHFFNNLMLDQSMWIFKWLITYYIYSFPFSLIKYIWNLVIEIGGFALVYFAVSLILNLRALLLSIHDQCDMSEFLQKLRDINIFNKLIKINHVIEYAYQLTVISQDFEGLNQLKPSFYKQYYKIVSEKLKQSQKLKVKEQDEEIKPVIKLNKKQEDILHNWYGKLLVQRMQFQKKQESQKLTERSIRLPENMKNQYEDLQKSLKFLQEKVIKNQQIKLSSKLIKDSERKNDFFDDLLYEESYEIQANPQKENLVPVLDAIKKCSTKFSHIDVEINQVQQFSDSNNQQIQQIQQNLQNMKQQESYFNDDIAQRNPNQYQLKIQTKYQTKINTLVGQQANSIKKYNNKELTEKANNIKPYIEEKKKGLCIVGQNILNNLSIAQSQHSSSLSSNNNFKPKKQKQNIIRQKIIKTKTQQKSQHSISPSQYESSIDGQTQKQVFSRVVKRQVANTQTQFDSTNIKYNNQTEREFIQNSHVHRIQQVLHENSLNNPCENNKTQIEIFNGNNLFKKKNKIHFRNSNNISISNNLNDHVQGLSENRNACSRKLQVNNYKEKFTDEQSLQYIIYPLSNRKKSGKKYLAQSCEIQSIQSQIKNF